MSSPRSTRQCLSPDMPPRPYQTKFVEELYPRATLEGHQSVLLVLPVGAGKTYTSRLVIEKIAPKERFDFWVLEHRRELGEQFDQALQGISYVKNSETVQLNPILIQAGQKMPAASPLRIIGRDTLAHRKIEPLRDCALLIGDEFHVWQCASYRKTLERFKAAYRRVFVLGLTATPSRLDGKPLGEIADVLIEPTTPAELFDSGVIWEPDVKLAPTPELAGISTHSGDYATPELYERSRKLMGDVVGEAKRYHEGRPFVVRATTIEHSKQLAERFRVAGFRAVHMDGTTSAADRNSLLARLSIGGLASTHEHAIDCITVSKGGLLAEGWNPESDYQRLLMLLELWAPQQFEAHYPALLKQLGSPALARQELAFRLIQDGLLPPLYSPLSLISDCCPTMSKCIYRQFEGRVCRTLSPQTSVELNGNRLSLPPLQPKTFARILSHSNNWQLHGFLRDHHGFSLTKPSKPAKPQLNLGKLVGARYCPQCLAVWPANRTVCACGVPLSSPVAPPTEDTSVELKSMPYGATPEASPSSVVSYLAALFRKWKRDNELRAIVGKPPIKEAQVTMIFKNYARRFPTSAELAAAKKAAFNSPTG